MYILIIIIEIQRCFLNHKAVSYDISLIACTCFKKEKKPLLLPERAIRSQNSSQNPRTHSGLFNVFNLFREPFLQDSKIRYCWSCGLNMDCLCPSERQKCPWNHLSLVCFGPESVISLVTFMVKDEDTQFCVWREWILFI